MSEAATPMRYYSLYHMHSRVEYYDVSISVMHLQLSIDQLALTCLFIEGIQVPVALSLVMAKSSSEPRSEPEPDRTEPQFRVRVRVLA